MSKDYVIEWANIGLDDWQEYYLPRVGTTEIENLSALSNLGKELVIPGLSHTEFKVRRMPRDPMLRAMVEAGKEAEFHDK